MPARAHKRRTVVWPKWPKKQTSSNQRRAATISVMTFNTWRMGQMVSNGLAKVAKYINRVNADIVGIQENVRSDEIDLLMMLVNQSYKKCSIGNGYTPIITSLPIVQSYQPLDYWNAGCKIALPNGGILNFWNVYLDYSEFSTYTACRNSREAVNLSSNFNLRRKRAEEIFRLEYGVDGKVKRLQQIRDITNYAPMHKNMVTSKESIILTGDLNTPSHLDWTNENAADHCGWVFNFPVTAYLHELNFTDTYRLLNWYIQLRGNTWSPVYKKVSELASYECAEPQDRIDYIMLRNSTVRGLTPVFSYIFHGDEKISEYPIHFNNDWPSDHSAVVTVFTLS